MTSRATAWQYRISRYQRNNHDHYIIYSISGIEVSRINLPCNIPTNLLQQKYDDSDKEIYFVYDSENSLSTLSKPGAKQREITVSI